MRHTLRCKILIGICRSFTGHTTVDPKREAEIQSTTSVTRDCIVDEHCIAQVHAFHQLKEDFNRCKIQKQVCYCLAISLSCHNVFSPV